MRVESNLDDGLYDRLEDDEYEIMTGSPSSGHPVGSVGRKKIPWSYGKSLRSSGLFQSSFVYLDCGGRIACTACTASVEEDDKTVEEWETEDDKGGLGWQRVQR